MKCAVDVGGANGTLLQMLQRKNPSLRGIVFDRRNTIEYAEAAIKQNGLTERTSAVGGNFFESVPEGDLYLLRASSCTTGPTKTASRSCRIAASH